LIWNVQRVRTSATEFHQRDLPAERAIWIVEFEQPALVLGSSQAMVNPAGVEVVRRRSGGGAVLVVPGGTLWVDVVVPRRDDLWDDDVGRATYWLGDAWAAAIGDRALVHRGAMVHNEWSDLVCFAGLGPGEVTVDGRKVVGISQRRTRQAARFQCVAYERWDPQPLVDLLQFDAALEAVGGGVGPLRAVEAGLLAAFAQL
jgi:lipoate-protein ligase A